MTGRAGHRAVGGGTIAGMTKPYWAMDEYERRQHFLRVQEGMRSSLAAMDRATAKQMTAFRQLTAALAKIRDSILADEAQERADG